MYEKFQVPQNKKYFNIFLVFLSVVCSENWLMSASVHLLVGMYKEEWEPVREVGHKPIRNGSQAVLHLLRKLLIVVLLKK